MPGLNQDSNGVRTSAEYADRGDGTSQWVHSQRIWDGGDVAQGDRSDAAAVLATADATVIAALKGILRLVGVSTSSQAASAIAHGSGNVANAIATATLVSAASKRTHLTKVVVHGAGATGASVVALTITGLTGGTRTFNIVVPAGVTTSIVPLILDFEGGFPASADNTPIVASLAAFGAGNTNAGVSVYGYTK